MTDPDDITLDDLSETLLSLASIFILLLMILGIFTACFE